MVWWIVGNFDVVVVARALFQWRHGILPPDPARTAYINDPQLGRLTRSESGKSWECRVSLGDMEIELSISGKKAGPETTTQQTAHNQNSHKQEKHQTNKQQAIA